MISVNIANIEKSDCILKSAYLLSCQLKKEFGIVWFLDIGETKVQVEREIADKIKQLELTQVRTYIIDYKSESIESFCEKNESSFLFIQLEDEKSKTIKGLLNNCRNLRIPYVYWKSSFSQLDINQVVLPIGFLEEELEKAQFASAFGRFSQSKIHMLLANDYGSKAKRNAEKMQNLFDKFNLPYTLSTAKSDSFKVEMEAIEFATKVNGGIIIISASRDYGLDDIFFGPKEFHVIRKSEIPILLVNPRGDLYALCD